MPSFVVRCSEEELERWTEAARSAEVSRQRWVREVLNAEAGAHLDPYRAPLAEASISQA
jgi:predicted HicB family RNase H-like nuclease